MQNLKPFHPPRAASVRVELVNKAVEKDNECAPPVATDRKRMIPTARSPHLVRGEIESVDLGLGQIVPPGNIALRLQSRKSWESIDKVLLPGP